MKTKKAARTKLSEASSGKVLVRVDPSVSQWLLDWAKGQSLSRNDLVAEWLSVLPKVVASVEVWAKEGLFDCDDDTAVDAIGREFAEVAIRLGVGGAAMKAAWAAMLSKQRLDAIKERGGRGHGRK